MSSFFDTNILLYLIGFDNPKRALAKKLLAAGGVVSVQVLNEFADVARRKMKLELSTVLESLAMIKDKFDVVPVTLAVHERAMEIAVATNLRTYDCNIVATADISGCEVLFTEDMNSGQRIGSVTVQNPFV